MRELVIFLFLFIFVSCSQNEEKKDNNQISNTIKTMSGINKVYNNYKEAFLVAKKKNKPVFILFTTKHCRWCKKLKERTFKDEQIIKRLNHDFIVLLLDKNYSNYPSKYNITAVPTVYIMNKDEKVFTSIVGYHKNPYDYIKWFNYVKVELST
ncbi:hypothetical protein MNB_SV-14-1350 [hydrothermal vent metagenome]|uniref:Spermatogenesis-associated protein 20-like TRX domain-containing protein n=1 Tax=hydrothermal vent metagenome TaxID=652676 RepID=A0A1W1CPF1_9ZZZZ